MPALQTRQLFNQFKPRLMRVIVFILLLTTFIMFLIAAIGWFFSPFFFMLYLWAIILGFVYSPITTTIFTAVLVGVFAVNIGQVDVVYDTLVVLSLLTVIPVTFYLSSYLKNNYSKKNQLGLSSLAKRN